MDYYLTPFEVTELFCRVINKYENNSSEMPRTPTVHNLNLLIEKCTIQYAEEFSRRCLKNIKNRKQSAKDENTDSKSRLLYDLKLYIEKGVPVVLSSKKLESLYTYLEMPNPHKSFVKQKVTEKQRLFEDTVWIVYSFNLDDDDQPGLEEIYLKFESFGKVRIIDLDQEYFGFYRTYGNAEHYILCEMKTDIQAKDLHILMYCGDKSPELMLGQYHNVPGKIESGTLILLPTSVEFDAAEPRFVLQDSPEYHALSQEIQDFFRKSNLQRIVVPDKITDLPKLKRWLKRQ
ncbi:hypothetical protein LZD49_18385 [Dyadobacter sp. CY261]|uniref:hypothetical protein n=1 Tax=Dyadobacter sp. CY261 TaxID=2907203 RepID=UPI001F1E5791|nr:hypothetical protein [Dyadobacter sp. CY261]MCF0072457.1 hypothetical protein [Dyadobacter sp. CY261]